MANEQEQNSSFYALGDDALGALVTAAPLRSSRSGKTDIAGRLRVGAILRKAGITTTEIPERVAGSTNEVWRAGDYIVRVGFIPGAERLRREALLAEFLPSEVRYPKVIASGSESFGEWIIVRHRPGLTLSQAWAALDRAARRSAVHDLAHAVKAIHQTRLDSAAAPRLVFREGKGSLALPHQLPKTKLLALLDSLKGRPFVDMGLIRAAAERVEAVSGVAGEHEENGLVHGDLHLENVLIKDGVIVAVVDFEWSRVGPKELDIDVLARFCAHPEVHVGGNYPVKAMDYRPVLGWMYQAYPELFGHELLLDRLMLCALAFEIPSLAAMVPQAPAQQLSKFHPINRLRDLLDNGTHAERLGWIPDDF